MNCQSTHSDFRPLRGGFTLTEILATLAIIGLLLAVTVPAVQSARESARRTHCTNQLKQFGIALHAFEATHRTLPAPLKRDTGTNVISNPYSVHTQILPMLDQSSIYNRIDLLRYVSYEDVVLQPVLQSPIQVFECPSDVHHAGGNNYRVCTGSGTIVGIENAFSGTRSDPAMGLFGRLRSHRLSEATDGLSQTAMASEITKSNPRGGSYGANDYWLSGYIRITQIWTTAEALAICQTNPANPPVSYPAVGHAWHVAGYSQTAYNHVVPPNPAFADCSMDEFGTGDTDSLKTGVFSARSFHPGGANVLLGDGHIQFVSSTIDTNLWRAIGTLAGHEVISF